MQNHIYNCLCNSCYYDSGFATTQGLGYFICGYILFVPMRQSVQKLSKEGNVIGYK